MSGLGLPTCFKAYDLRGRVPEELDEAVAEAVGLAYADEIRPAGPVVVGRDVRLSSPGLAAALIGGLNRGGVDTHELGLCGTEMVYYAAAQPGMGGGIMVTASHNPAEYNGMKLVRAGAVPIGGDSGLVAIGERVAGGPLPRAGGRAGRNQCRPVLDGYIELLLSMISPERLAPLKIVVNSGNGGAGLVVDRLASRLPFELVRVQHEPDGSFPNGVPNPLLPESRGVTAAAVREMGADFGVAWDGDFDRCFFFDERGEFIEGYYVVGLLAERLLRRHPGAAIIYDPRLTWNTVEQVVQAGGRPVPCPTGHVFMKEKMRREDAVYGGEMSAHHYFRSFHYCDSGMIPWLLVAEMMSEGGASLSTLVGERQRRYPCSGEINRERLVDAAAAVERVRRAYAAQASRVEAIDGLSMEFGARWRFNLRQSNTEPTVRLNVEACGDRELMAGKTREILALIDGG